MTAGDLRDRVTIQQDTLTADSQGGRSAVSSTLATVWAAVVPMGASEAMELREFVGHTSAYTVTLRYRADVTPQMRLLWTPYLGTPKTLQIHGVQMSADRTWLVLRCAEGVV